MNETIGYQKINWKDSETPLNAVNLNHMEEGIYDNTIKLNQLENQMVDDLKYEDGQIQLMAKDQKIGTAFPLKALFGSNTISIEQKQARQMIGKADTIISFDQLTYNNSDCFEFVDHGIRILKDMDAIKLSASIHYSNFVQGQVPVLRICMNQNTEKPIFQTGITSENSYMSNIVTISNYVITNLKKNDTIHIYIHGNTANIETYNLGTYFMVESC